eukprot:TRINITY_DN3367_c0_g1_i1.p1 TRINITY_DN3367_c0_g1~~TRINITY_DN3367_c0_g1_i1.p1  ORF type:complete len:180 (+),score=37.57 TRINITY_DN3367_c0_g1_i1:21-560(+)
METFRNKMTRSNENTRILLLYKDLLFALDPSCTTECEKEDLKASQNSIFNSACLGLSSAFVPLALFFGLNLFRVGRLKRFLIAGASFLGLFISSNVYLYYSVKRIEAGSTPLGALLRSNSEDRTFDHVFGSIIERMLESSPEIQKQMSNYLKRDQVPQRLKDIVMAKRREKVEKDSKEL